MVDGIAGDAEGAARHLRPWPRLRSGDAVAAEREQERPDDGERPVHDATNPPAAVARLAVRAAGCSLPGRFQSGYDSP